GDPPRPVVRLDPRGGGAAAAVRPPGVRVVLDARPLQEPDRAPTTAAYLGSLLAAYDASPLEGESFAFLLGSDLDDPTASLARLSVVGRRLLPPTRLLRSGALTVDPFVLRGASLGAAWRAERGGAAGAVYHAAGGGVPLLSRIPTVVTLLDLAPWELPHAYQRGTATRFGQRLRAQLLRDAAAVIVGTPAVASAARRLLHLRRDRVHLVPLAARPEFRPLAAETANVRVERERLGLPPRYLVYSGRYDARQDLSTLLRALADLAARGRPASLSDDAPWPPRLLLVGASPDDRAAVARAAAREGVGESLAYAPALPTERLATLVAGARAAILPVVSEAAGLAAVEAIASGTPVVASAVGALPDIVGTAGILVEPRDPGRLAVALATAWSDDGIHEGLVAAAMDRARGDRRTWLDVAADTRRVYAAVGVRPLQRSA
ncbi:MAG TPA: glycosyltransferase, partial [Candidatus Limnocylindrales bacterium]|nr:glycosyltransferase [Candidatus Limnocylindrales bacterium]